MWFDQGGITYFAFIRYRQGIQSDFQGGFGDDAFQATGGVPPGGVPVPPQTTSADPQAYNTAPFAGQQQQAQPQQPAGDGNNYQQQPFQQPNY